MRFFKHSDPVLVPDSFGSIAVELGYITEHQLRTALEQQPRYLGDMLVSTGVLTPVQRDEVLAEQMYRRGMSRRKLAHAALHRQRAAVDTLRMSLSDLAVFFRQAVGVLKVK